MANKINVTVEYCNTCDHLGHCLALAKKITDSTPEANVTCNKGRQGSFEVVINNQLAYSKLQTMALPDYNEVVEVVKDVASGGTVKEIKGQQPIDCVMS